MKMDINDLVKKHGINFLIRVKESKKTIGYNPDMYVEVYRLELDNNTFEFSEVILEQIPL